MTVSIFHRPRSIHKTSVGFEVRGWNIISYHLQSSRTSPFPRPTIITSLTDPTTMLRERKRNSSSSAYEKGSKGHGNERNSNNSKQSPLIPTPILIGTVLFFIFLGFASEHYKKSRSADPFSGRSLGLIKASPKASPVINASPKGASKGKSKLSPEEDESLEYDNGERYHVIFSTDCSPYQHWQSYLVYYTAMNVKQTGHITRIVSGCNPEEAKAMEGWFDENIRFMSKRFHIHLTPKFSEVKDESGKVVGEFKFYNKPHGLKHWLENFELMGFKDGGSFDHEDDVVFLIDPDMALLRPLTSDFSSERETLIAKKRQGEKLVSHKVKRGAPFAQTYGLGTQWERFDLDTIAGADSPAKQVNKEDGSLYYPAGPPYIGTVHDMYLIAQKWTEFVPKVHAQYPYLLAEMYAYCIAAAHLGLRHQMVDSLMISGSSLGGEGWPLIDKIPNTEMCDFARHPDHSKYALPSLVHLCQRYSVGDDWFFGKHKIPHDIYECESPLFEEPPSDVATAYTYKKPPNAKERTQLSPKVINQESFMVCFLTTLLNDAATFYKSNACHEGTANLEKSHKVADLFVAARKK